MQYKYKVTFAQVHSESSIPNHKIIYIFNIVVFCLYLLIKMTFVKAKIKFVISYTTTHALSISVILSASKE